jgi:hypothetical protein
MFLGSDICVCYVYHKSWTWNDILIVNSKKHARFDVLTVKTMKMTGPVQPVMYILMFQRNMLPLQSGYRNKEACSCSVV